MGGDLPVYTFWPHGLDVGGGVWGGLTILRSSCSQKLWKKLPRVMGTSLEAVGMFKHIATTLLSANMIVTCKGHDETRRRLYENFSYNV